MPSVDWENEFPATDGPGITGYFIEDPDGPLSVKITILVPDDGQAYIFFWWQEYGGSEYIADLHPGQNDLSFTLDDAGNEYGLIRALVWFAEGGTSGVNVTIPEAPVLSVPSGLVAEDDEATTSANTPVTVDVLANDTFNDEPVALEDLAGPPTIVAQPPVGTATVNADGTITYTPPDGFTGEVEFQYRIDLPEPEPCAWVYPVWDTTAIYPDNMGDLPSWFVQEDGFDLLWQGNENHWWWQSEGGRYLPADGPTPELCDEFVGTLRQGGNEVCVTIYTECPA